MKTRRTILVEVMATLILASAFWWTIISRHPVTSTVVSPNSIVVIDPGHGGRDPGAIGITGVWEKQVNLAVSLALSSDLRERGVTVYLTRASDQAVNRSGPYSVKNDLLARSRFAKQHHATLFITIHSNIEPTRTMQGPIVYYDTHSAASSQLAITVSQSIHSLMGYNRPPRPINQLVLEEAEVPAVNIEIGFLSHSRDSAQLITPSYQRTLAQAIASGLIQYLHQRGYGP